jgi:hypothetical protein
MLEVSPDYCWGLQRYGSLGDSTRESGAEWGTAQEYLGMGPNSSTAHQIV